MTLFSFLFNTFQPRLNNKTNKRFWLPRVLQGIDNPDPAIGDKLLPLKGLDWALGKIKGDAGVNIAMAIVAAARPLEEGEVDICNPDDEDDDDNYPTLSMNDGTVLGLDNLFVCPDPLINESPEGYKATIELKFEAYDHLAKLSLNASYQLEQKMKIQDSRKTSIKTIVGAGSFTSKITNAQLQADIEIRIIGSNSLRKSALTITELRLVSATGIDSPVFDTEVLTINAEAGFDKIWLELSNIALNDSTTRATMLQNLTTTLNEPQNLHSLSLTLNQQLDKALDSLFGQTEQLPSDSNQEFSNAADIYLFDRLRVAINDRQSHLYLPRQLLSINSPKIEPLDIDHIDIGKQKAGGLFWQPNILSQINITGLANNLVPVDNIHVREHLLTMLAYQGVLITSNDRLIDGKEIPAAPLQIHANFSLSPPNGITSVTGTLTVSASNSQLEIHATPAGTMLDNLVITLKQMMLKADFNAIKIDLKITSDSKMNRMANNLVNQDSVKQKLINQLNEQIRNNLASISQQVSESVVKYGTEALDN
jgi:hypothetical protein